MIIAGDTRCRRCARRAQHVVVNNNGNAKGSSPKGEVPGDAVEGKPYQTPVTSSTLLPMSTGKGLL